MSCGFNQGSCCGKGKKQEHPITYPTRVTPAQSYKALLKHYQQKTKGSPHFFSSRNKAGPLDS